MLTLILFDHSRNDVNPIVLAETDSEADYRECVDVQSHVPVCHQRHAEGIRHQNDANKQYAGRERAKTDSAENQLRQQHQSQGELVRAGNNFIGRGKHAGIAAGKFELSTFDRVDGDKLRRPVNDFPQSVALVIVEKKSHTAVLEVVVDPSIKIARLATVLGDHQDSADLVAGARQQAPARIIVV